MDLSPFHGTVLIEFNYQGFGMQREKTDPLLTYPIEQVAAVHPVGLAKKARKLPVFHAFQFYIRYQIVEHLIPVWIIIPCFCVPSCLFKFCWRCVAAIPGVAIFFPVGTT